MSAIANYLYACADLLRHCCPRRCVDAAAGFRLRVAWPHYKPAQQIRYITLCGVSHEGELGL